MRRGWCRTTAPSRGTTCRPPVEIPAAAGDGAGDDMTVVPRRGGGPRRAVDDVDRRGGLPRTALSRRIGGSSTIHSTYYQLLKILHPRSGRPDPGPGTVGPRGAGTVKFRCERDVLADALATCGRAVRTRSSSLPVLSGIQLSLTGDTLQLTGTDLELTITIESGGGGRARTAPSVIPARLLNDIVRSLDPGARHRRRARRRGRDRRGRSQFSLRLIPAEDFPRPAEPSRPSR